MQILRTAARSFSLIVLAVAAAAAQNNSHSSNPGARGPAMGIDKVNKRPAAISVERAIKEYEALMVKSPSDPIILNNLGANYYIAGRYYEAQSLIRKAAERAPDSALISINLAIAYNKVYNPALAITTLEGVLKRHPEQKRARPILCDLYGQEKRNKEAAGCYETVGRTQKLDALAAANFGTVLLELGEVDSALRVLQPAEAEFPNDPGLKNGLGVALFRKKKYSQAEVYLARAVEMRPDALQLRFNLAVAQMMTQNRGSALEQYRYLKNADPELAGKLYKLIFGDKLVFVDKK